MREPVPAVDGYNQKRLRFFAAYAHYGVGDRDTALKLLRDGRKDEEMSIRQTADALMIQRSRRRTFPLK